MDFDKIEFIEHYIDEAPKDNYWRGITVKYKGVILLYINYDPCKSEWETSGFYIRGGVIPLTVANGMDDIQIITNYTYITKKEDVIEESKECIKRYLKLFE